MSAEPTTLRRGDHYHPDWRERNAKAVALLERWAAEDPAYDRQIWPEIELGLDENRPPGRKLFDVEPDTA